MAKRIGHLPDARAAGSGLRSTRMGSTRFAHAQRWPLAGIGHARRSIGYGVIAALAAAIAGATTLPSTTQAQGAGLDYIEVTSTCSLAEAIVIANANALARATADCPGIADGTTTIRITRNSGTATNPLTGVDSPGVQLSSTAAASGDLGLGGTKTILPTIVGDVTIEGDPTGVQPATGYSIYADGTPSSITGVSPTGNRIFAVWDALGGSLTLRNLNIGGGRAVPPSGIGAGQGGAIYSQGPLTLDHVTLLGNHAGGGAASPCDDAICERYDGSRPEGSPGVGGAVYATNSLTVLSSVFESNTVTGGSGTDGGSALGAAIGLGDAATATISDSIFVANLARGGSGAAGVNGDDGADGRDGGNGTCAAADVATYDTASVAANGEEGVFRVLILDGVDQQFSGASGGNGEGGTDGSGGTDGGDGGDAVGVISGGASVSIDHSSFIENDAIAGAAGVQGLGGLGGDGGDGGNGVVCGSSRSAAAVIDADEKGIGFGGNGGQGANNGRSGTPGARGSAVATVRSGRVTLVNVTTVGGLASVPDDNYGPLGKAAWTAARSQRLDPGSSGAGAGGAGGTAVQRSGGVPGLPGGGGARDTGLIDRERAAGLGRVSLIEATTSTATSARISFSTFADVASRPPPPGETDANDNLGVRGNESTPVVFSASRGQIKGSLLWNEYYGGCALLASGGWNVFGPGCQGEAGTQVDRARDRVVTVRPVLGAPAGAGVEIRPHHSGGAAFRMPVLPLGRGSAALDIALFGVGNGSGPCQVLGATGTSYLATDARRGPRPVGVTNSCDSGAFEDEGADPFVMLTGDYRAHTGAPGRMTAVVARNPGFGTSLVVRVDGLDGVDFPDGFVPTVGDLDPNVSEATIALADTVTYPFAPTFFLEPDRSGVAFITATILGATGGTTVATTAMTLVNDGQVVVTAEAPPSWRACQGYLPITYTATSVGRSPAPASTVRVWPDVVFPDNANGLTTPPGEASSSVVEVAYASGSSTVAVSAFDDSVFWSIPALGAGASVTLKTYVYVGRIVNSTDGYVVGQRLTVGSRIAYQSGSTNTPLRPFDPIQGSVRVLSDIAALGGTLAGAEARPEVEPVLKAGEVGTLYGTLDPGACSAPTDRHDWGYTHVTVKDHASGAVLAEYDTQNLAVDDNSNPALDGNPWFPIPVTAPTAPGTYLLDFVYNPTPTNAVTAESVVLEMPYRVQPVLVYVEGDGAAPESTAIRTITAKLDRALTEDVTLAWKTVSATARVGSDLPAQSGTVEIPAGNIEASITVTVTDDSTPEQDEFFAVQFAPSTNAPLPQGTQLAGAVARAYIEDDDGAVPTTLTSSPSTTIAVGGSVTPSAALSAGGEPMLGMVVTLQQSADGATGWTDVASHVTRLEGVATSAALTPAATTYYRWVFPAVDRFEASTSAVTTVTVQATPSTTAPPTTAPPTTSAPTTSAPTTSTPTTSTPTTAVSTTVPSTSAPSTSAPSTAVPTTVTPGPSLTSSSTDLTAGQTVTLTASGFEPGETLSFVLQSDPVDLGAAVTDSNGVATWTGALPSVIEAGSHQFIATGLTSGLVANLAVMVTAQPAVTSSTAPTVPSGRLPETGAGITDSLRVAGLLLSAGLGVILLTRRRDRGAPRRSDTPRTR